MRFNFKSRGILTTIVSLVFCCTRIMLRDSKASVDSGSTVGCYNILTILNVSVLASLPRVDLNYYRPIPGSIKSAGIIISMRPLLCNPLNVCVFVLSGSTPDIAAHCGVLCLNDQTRNHSQVLWYILIHVKIDQRTPVGTLRRSPCQTRVSMCAMVGLPSHSFSPGVWSRILLRPGN